MKYIIVFGILSVLNFSCINNSQNERKHKRIKAKNEALNDSLISAMQKIRPGDKKLKNFTLGEYAPSSWSKEYSIPRKIRLDGQTIILDEYTIPPYVTSDATLGGIKGSIHTSFILDGQIFKIVFWTKDMANHIHESSGSNAEIIKNIENHYNIKFSNQPDQRGISDNHDFEGDFNKSGILYSLKFFHSKKKSLTQNPHVQTFYDTYMDVTFEMTDLELEREWETLMENKWIKEEEAKKNANAKDF